MPPPSQCGQNITPRARPSCDPDAAAEAPHLLRSGWITPNAPASSAASNASVRAGFSPLQAEFSYRAPVVPQPAAAGRGNRFLQPQRREFGQSCASCARAAFRIPAWLASAISGSGPSSARNARRLEQSSSLPKPTLSLKARYLLARFSPASLFRFGGIQAARVYLDGRAGPHISIAVARRGGGKIPQRDVRFRR